MAGHAINPIRSAINRLNWQSICLGSVRERVERVMADPDAARHIPNGKAMVEYLRAGEAMLRGTVHDLMRKDGRASAIGKQVESSKRHRARAKAIT